MSDPISFTPPEPSEFTKLLNGYEVSSLVAKGGMGAVYRATQVSLEREVAIKLLPEELCDPEFREQFRAEAQAMAKLNHPNLIGIFDYGDADGMPYIVMEYVAGKSLYYSSYGKAIDQTTAVEIIIGICRGLAAAHDSGIIHRDIKPANILLDASASPKIGDFGLASPADNEDEGEGVVYGTPGYAAPEIFDDATAIGVPSDLYAVGVILYELLTGKMPDTPASPPSTLAKCDTRLDPIFKKATRRNPALRHQSANDLADELEKILPSLGTSGRRAIKTGADVAKNPVVLKRRLTSDQAAGEEEGASSKPKLVALKKGESAPSAKPKLTPKPEEGHEETDQEGQEPAPAPAAVAVETASNWPIIRNLLIIACLIPAIIFTWGLYEEKQEKLKAERDARELVEKNKEIEREANKEKERLARAEKERIAAEEKARRDQFEKERMAEVAREAAKTPMERLEEFRGNLYSGRRDQFPSGTIDRSTHYLFFVDRPMTWSEAAEFAERHGAHLATPSTQTEIDVIAKRMDGEFSRVWIGGGTTAASDWGWVNGDAWTYRKPGTTLGSCAALTDTSVIKARPNAEKNPFVMQWSTDGTNPGTMAAQMERLVATLDSPSPAWPPSTVFHENRAFLLVYKEVSWEEADLIASSADGHLAVVSKTIEGIFIRDYLQASLPPQQSAWLGGQLVKGAWTWETGEAWTKASWAPNSPDGDASDSALRYLNAPDAAGWDDAEPSAGNAQSFLIEWSNDAKANAPVGKVTAVGNDELKKLRSIGKRLVAQEIEGYQKALVGNRDNFLHTINTWHRILSKNNKAAYDASLLALHEQIPEGGDLLAVTSLGNLPQKIHDAFGKAKLRQENRKKAFDAKLVSLRQNYLKKLLTMRDTYEKGGLKAQIGAVDAEIKAIGQDGESFRAYFGD